MALAQLRRNRIISVLSQAVIIVEVGENRDGLDSPAWGKRRGRLVCAIPGIEGTARLIEEEILRTTSASHNNFELSLSITLIKPKIHGLQSL